MDFNMQATTADFMFLLTTNPAYERPYTQLLLPFPKVDSDISNAISWMEKTASIRALDTIASLPDNWDGYGASHIEKLTAENAHEALHNLTQILPAPDITPNPNGTISFEWETQSGLAYLEIGMTRYSLFIKPMSGKIIPVDGAASRITRDLASLISSSLFPDQNRADTMTRIEFSCQNVLAAA